MFRILSALLFLTASASAQGWLPLVAPPDEGYVFERLKIGDGGFGSRMGIANDGTRVMNTDISNAYVWGSGDTEWRSCINASSLIASGYDFSTTGAYYSAWDFVIAPSDSDRIYMLYGTTSSGVTSLFRTDDQCQTWVYLTNFVGTTDARGGQSFALASGGQRIAVDPANPDVFYVGSSTTGKVYRSLDAGATFTLVTDGSGNDLAAETTYGLGISGSAIWDGDGTTTLSGTTVSNVVYINAWGRGVWRSGDGGANFTKISDPSDFSMPLTVPSIPNGAMVMATAETCMQSCNVAPIINPVTSPNLTWTFRSAYTENSNSGRRFATYYAINTTGSTLTNEVVTANFAASGQYAFAGVSAFVFTGQHASPFDGSTATRNNDSSPALSITTTVNDTIIIAQLVNTGSTPSSGFTCVSPCGTTSPANGVSVLHSTTPNTATGTFTPNLTGGTARGGIADAIKAASPASLALVSAQTNRDQTTIVAPTVPYLGWYGKVSCNGTYYLGMAHSTGVWKWTGSWSQLTPPGATGTAMMAYPKAAALNHADCEKIFVSIGKRATTFNTSSDEGATWHYASTKSAASPCQNMTQSAPTVPWFDNPWFEACDFPSPPGNPPMNSLDVGDGQFNPVTGRLELSTGFCYYTAAITFTDNELFDYEEKCSGPESTVAVAITSVPGGANHFGVHDIGMFWNLNSTSNPTQRGPQFQFSSALTGCDSFSYSSQNPTHVFALCNQGASGIETSGYTTTGATDYTGWYLFGQEQNPRGQQFNSNVPTGFQTYRYGQIAANACDVNNVVIRQGNGGNLWRTTNALAATGVLSWSQVNFAAVTTPSISISQLWNVVPDRGLVSGSCDKFYGFIYTGANAGIYASTDKGATWQSVYAGTLFPVNQGGAYIDSVPNKYNELYGVSGYTFGNKPTANTFITRSTDGGATWNTCPGIVNPFSFTFGAGPGDDPLNPVVYVLGYSSGVSPVFGLYQSLDDCQTWTRIGTGSAGPFANWKNELYMNSMQPPGFEWAQDSFTIGGDMNKFGYVYSALRPGAGFTCVRPANSPPC